MCMRRRVTVVCLSVCLFVCFSVCLSQLAWLTWRLKLWNLDTNGLQTILGWLQYMLQSYATVSYYRNMNCRDLFKFCYLVGYAAYNWVRVGIQHWVVVVKWLHNYSLLWTVSYYAWSDQPHNIHPQLTTKISFPEGLQFTCLYKQSACHI